MFALSEECKKVRICSSSGSRLHYYFNCVSVLTVELMERMGM